MNQDQPANGKVVNLRRDDTNTTLRKARNWIARWKLIGGCFQVSMGVAGVEVTIARVADDSEAIAATQTKAAAGLETELAASPDTHTMVCALVRAAWTAQHRERLEGEEYESSTQVPIAQNDDDNDDAA